MSKKDMYKQGFTLWKIDLINVEMVPTAFHCKILQFNPVLLGVVIKKCIQLCPDSTSLLLLLNSLDILLLQALN